jgi:hypothetical protein
LPGTDSYLVYRYRLTYPEPVTITSVAVEGAAWHGDDCCPQLRGPGVLRLLDENGDVIARTETSVKNVFRTFEVVPPPNTTGTTFYLEEFNTSVVWRYRSRITVNAGCAITAFDPRLGATETHSASMPATFAELRSRYSGDLEGSLGENLNALAHTNQSTEFWEPKNSPIARANLEDLRPLMNLLQFQVGLLGGTLNVTSAFRPQTYQGHLLDVKTQAQALVNVLDNWAKVANGIEDVVGNLPHFETCRAIAAAVNNEIFIHKIDSRPPRSNRVDLPEGSITVTFPGLVASTDGPHTHGIAADASFSLSPTTIDNIAAGVFRPLKEADPTHFVMITSSQPQGSSGLLRVTYNSPVLGLVTDPLGRRIGFDPIAKSIVNEIGSTARYSGILTEPQTIEIEAPIDGVYRIEAIGTGDGPYTITVETGAGEGQGLSAVVATGTAVFGEPIEPNTITIPLADTVVDTVPPTSAASIIPLPNAAGWNTSPVTVQISSVDDSTGSGVSSVTYAVTGAQSISSTTIGGGVAAFSIVNEGASTIAFFATDNRGNREMSHDVVVRLDQTPPVISFAGNAGSYTITQAITISCSATDALSGVASNTCAAAGLNNVPAYTLGTGSHVRSASATDFAGNNGSGSTTFTVVMPPGSLCGLTTQFIQSSGKYLALQPAQRAIVDKLGVGLCQQLAAIIPKLSSAQKAALVGAYKKGMTALVPPGWLTPSQAAILANFANGL